MVTRADSHELRPLTGIRAIAAMGVVLFHFNGFQFLFPSMHYLDPVTRRGSDGVDLFFILSGLILSYVYCTGETRLTSREYGKFVWFRMARIYPNHLATLGLLAVLVFAAHLRHLPVNGNYPLSGLFFQITLLHSWPFVPGNDGSQWNFPAWSISAEWFAYLCIFPLAWRLLGRMKNKAALMLVLANVLLAGWIVLLHFPQLREFASLIQVSLEFLAGSFVFGFYKSRPPFALFCQRYLDAIVIAMLAALYCLPVFLDSAVILFFPYILLGLTGEQSLFARLLSTRVFLWLGNVSYALYMTHAISMKVLLVVLPAEKYTHAVLAVRVCVLLGYLSVIILAAVTLYYAVEVPCRNFLRRVYNRMGAAAVPKP